MGIIESFLVSWYYPILNYSFPDEGSFKVDIENRTGYKQRDLLKKLDFFIQKLDLILQY